MLRVSWPVTARQPASVVRLPFHASWRPPASWPHSQFVSEASPPSLAATLTHRATPSASALE